MKPVKNSLISIGIMLFLIIAFNIGNDVTSAYASPQTTQQTITELFADRLEAHTFDTISFTIHVSSGGIAVPNGQVQVYEQSTPSGAVTENIVDGTATIDFIVQPGLPSGWCTFVAEYLGTAEYDTSIGTTEVSLSDPQGTGVWETETVITPSLTQAGVNENITFAVDVTILGGAFPFFSGGYIALIDLTENIVLDRHDIGLSPVLTYSINFDFSVPSWYSTGVHLIEAYYSGSYDADHAPSSGTCQVQLVIDGNMINLTSNTTEVNREDGTIELNATILGDDPIGQTILLKASQNNGTIQMNLQEITLTSSNYIYVFDPTYNYQLGPILFEIFLKDSVSDDILAEANLSAVIYDTVKCIYEFDQPSYTDGDYVSLTVYSVENDVPTQPVMSEITVTDITQGIQLIETTNAFGRADFSWLIPINSSGGTYDISIAINPSSIYLQGIVKSTSITVYGDIQFDISYPINAQRGAQVTLSCTILSNNGTIVDEGTLNLKNSGNTVIWSTSLSGPAQYQYTFSQSAAIGPTTFIWDYSGTANYMAGTSSFSITVLSVPHFTSLTLNKSNAVEQEAIKITGQLVDEVGQGVSGVDVTIWDSGILIGTSTTQIDGIFTYDYIIPIDTSLGIHVIESHFDGNYSVYKLASNNFGSAILTINAPVQVNINNTLIAGETAQIQVSGGPNEEITLSWSPLENQSLWTSIGSIILDQNGEGTWNWEVPSYKGNVSIRGKNDANYIDYAETSIYVHSEISVNNLPNVAIVNQQFTTQINVSEEYRILLDQNSIVDWRAAGLQELTISLPTRGIHTLKIETQGEFVIQESFTYIIEAYEPLVITMDIPSSISTTTTINTNIHVAGLYTGNVNGIAVELFANDIEMATGTTTSSGNVSISFNLFPGTYTITAKVNGQSLYYQDGESSGTIVVRSGTNLNISVGNIYYYNIYSLNANLKDDQANPISGENIQFSISNDQGSTWTVLGQSTTTGTGIAQYDWFVGLSPGNYLIRVSFAGSYYYDASSKTIGVTILPSDIQIIWDNPIGTYGTSIPLNGSITTYSGEVLNTSLHLTISVYYEDQWMQIDEIDSTESGIIGLIINLTFNPGTYPIQITFNGNSNFNSHISERSLIVNQIETEIIAAQSSYITAYGTIQTIPLSITTISGDPIQSGTVTYSLLDGNNTILSSTGAIIDGQSTLSIPIEQVTIGNYILQISWPGTVTEAESSTNVDLTVNKGTAQLDVTITESTIDYGDTTIWYAYVTNSIGNPIENIPVNFATSKTGFYWDDWGTIMTNSSGYAEIEIVWTLDNQVHYGSPGTYTIRISIQNNDMVNTQQTTRMITIQKMNVILNLNDTNVLRLDIAEISGTLTTEFGEPMSNVILSISWNGTANGNWQELGIVTTDSIGNFIFNYEFINIPKSYSIRAEYDGDTYHNAATQDAILEVLDNTSILQNIGVSENSLNLGDSFSIQVNVTDLDQINTVFATIYDNSNSFEITLEMINNTYYGTVFCGTEYKIGIWYINITVIDELGLNTVFMDAIQVEIVDNPAPIVSYTLDHEIIDDGDTIQFEVIATDTLGIYEVTIEIEGQTYPISTENETTFYFNYSPKGTGIIPFTLTVEDYGGQQTVVTANFEVQAVTPGLDVVSMSPLNGTAPFPFFLSIDATDNSGVNSVVLSVNGELNVLEYNQETAQWEINTFFSAGNYSLTVTVIDNAGVEKSIELGMLEITNPSFELSATQFELGDTLNIEVTGLNPEVIANAKIVISNSEYSEEYSITNISSLNIVDVYLNEYYPLATYSVILEIEDFNGTTIIYDNGNEFTISTNSNPLLNVVFEKSALADGEATNFTIEATDTLGIQSIVIIRGTETISLSVDENGIATGEIQFDKAGTYMIQVVARDNAGAQTQKTFIFTVNAEGPEFVNVYPTQTMLAGLHTPFTLDIEALVMDASGVTNVTLYVNGTEYALINTFGVWYTSVDLSEATYTMKLVASDIYGTESVYNLGTVTPQENKVPDRDTTSENSSDSGPSIPDVEPKVDSTAILVGLTLLTIIGSSVLTWKRKE